MRENKKILYKVRMTVARHNWLATIYTYAYYILWNRLTVVVGILERREGSHGKSAEAAYPKASRDWLRKRQVAVVHVRKDQRLERILVLLTVGLAGAVGSLVKI